MARFHQDDNGYMVPCGATKVPCPKGGAFHTDAEDTAGANRNREAWLREQNESPVVKKDPYAGKTMVSSATGAEFTIGEKFVQAGEEYYKATDESGNEVTLAANNMGRFEEKAEEPEAQQSNDEPQVDDEYGGWPDDEPQSMAEWDREQLEKEARKAGVSVSAYKLAQEVGSVAIPGSPVPGEARSSSGSRFEKDMKREMFVKGEDGSHQRVFVGGGASNGGTIGGEPGQTHSFTFQRMPMKSKKVKDMSDAEFEALVKQPVAYYRGGQGIGAYMVRDGKWRTVKLDGQEETRLLIDPAYIPTSPKSAWGSATMGIRVGDGVFLKPNGMIVSERGGVNSFHIPGHQQVDLPTGRKGRHAPDEAWFDDPSPEESRRIDASYGYDVKEATNPALIDRNPYFQTVAYYADSGDEEEGGECASPEILYSDHTFYGMGFSTSRLEAGHEPGYIAKDLRYNVRYLESFSKNPREGLEKANREGAIATEVMTTYAEERAKASQRATGIFLKTMGSYDEWENASLKEKRKKMEMRQDMIEIMQSREETLKHVRNTRSPYNAFANEVLRSKSPVPFLGGNKVVQDSPTEAGTFAKEYLKELPESVRTGKPKRSYTFALENMDNARPKKDMEWFSYPTDEEM